VRYSAEAVVNCILDIANNKKIILTNGKINRLLYFCHGWHLAYYNKPLIADNFCATKFAIVVPEVFNFYQRYGRWEVPHEDKMPSDTTVDGDMLKFIKDVVDAYGNIGTMRLTDYVRYSDIDNPWQIARNNRKKGEIDTLIDDDAILKYFKKLKANGRPF